MAAAQACGEHEVGYGTGAGYSVRRTRRTARAADRHAVAAARIPRDPVRLLDEAVAHQAGGEDGVVVRPHRTVVVADRVVGAHVVGKGAHTPAAEHRRRQQVLRDGRRLVLVDDAGPQAVPHVGGQRVDRALVAVQREGEQPGGPGARSRWLKLP